jgi:UDP-galactopyranose mutase
MFNKIRHAKHWIASEQESERKKDMKQIKNLIVGAGFSGATLARKLAEDGQKIVVIDAKDHIAGNAFDYRDKNGIMIHKYGSHIFHTNLEDVWAFVRRFGKFNTYMHKVIALIDGVETNIPFNFRTLYDVFPQTLARRIEEKLLARI